MGQLVCNCLDLVSERNDEAVTIYVPWCRVKKTAVSLPKVQNRKSNQSKMRDQSCLNAKVLNLTVFQSEFLCFQFLSTQVLPLSEVT